jgi:hypothetical protein
MLKKMCFLSMLILTLSIVTISKAKSQEVNIDYFYDQLSPYGHWDNTDSYGWVWRPYDTRPGWRPYSDGYWVYTEYGWTYQADNNWGWAVYHYGRWAYLDYEGWVWVPGTEWAPAWVAWRNDDNYIGWAPLPPQVQWRAGIGLNSQGFNIDVDIHWSNWNFVEVGHFDDPRVGFYIYNPARNVTFLRRTRDITRYDYVNQHIINRCIDPDRWERMYHRPLIRFSIIDAPTYKKTGVYRSPNRSEIRVYRPQFHSEQYEGAPRQMGDRRDLSSTRRYDKERSRYDKHYDKEYHKLVENQHQEEISQDRNREEVQRQHNAELDAYREQRSRETRVLENKHVNDMDKVVRQNPGNDNRGRSESSGRTTAPNTDRGSDKQQKDQRQPGRR